MSLEIARTDAEIESCFEVMAELRPHLVRERFVEQVRRQEGEGYRLAFLREGGRVLAVAGFRPFECLADGRVLYVDDLVTLEGARSAGHGARLFAWLVGEARARGCHKLRLDSAVHRFGAHRFYLRQGMEIRSHHFILDIGR
jgi:GNAT superfamily N-acetyltransferase